MERSAFLIMCALMMAGAVVLNLVEIIRHKKEPSWYVVIFSPRARGLDIHTDFLEVNRLRM